MYGGKVLHMLQCVSAQLMVCWRHVGQHTVFDAHHGVKLAAAAQGVCCSVVIVAVVPSFA